MKSYLKKEVTNPIPMESLESECKKAYTILKGFVTPVKYQPDKFIPPFVLQRARGLAVLSVIKGGFVFSGRVGAGIVIARTEDGSWSAPAAIGTAGVGWGFQAGAELADFVIVLNTKDAVKAFSHGNVTLGGNVSVAAGPIGRNAEASAAVTITAVFSYSRTRGLFAGVSLEGSVIAERKDANKKFYGDHATTRAILSGAIARPNAAKDLYELLHKVDKNEIKEIDHHSHSHGHGHGSGIHHRDGYSSHGSYNQGGGGFPGAPPPGAPPGGYYDQQGNYREAPPGSYDPNGSGYYNAPPPGGYYDEQGNYREAPPGGPGGYPPQGGFNPQQSGNFGPGGGYQSHPSYSGPPGGPPGQVPQGSYRDAPSGNFGGPQGGPPPLQQQGSFNNGPPGQVPQGSYRDAPSGNFGGPQGGPPLQQQGSFNNGPPGGPGNFQPQNSFNNGPQGGYQPQQSFNNGPQNSFNNGPPGGLQGGYQPQQSFNNGPQNSFNGPPGGYQPQQSFNGPPGGGYGGQRDMGDQQFHPQPSQGGGSHIGAPAGGGGPIGKAKGVYNFEAADDTELSFKFDDIIIVWKQHGDWWEGELNGKRGLIPANYVELL